MNEIKTITSLSDEDKTAELQEFLSSLTNDQLVTLITDSALNGKVGEVIKGVLKGSPPDSTEGADRRMLVYQHCIPLCESGDVQTKVAADIIGLLMLETHSLSGPSLVQLASLFVDAIKNGKMGNAKSLELFPTILTALAACAEDLLFGREEVNGKEHKKRLLHALCSSRWDPKHVISLTTMFRDVPLSPEELEFLVEKILRMFPKLDLQEIPPLVYQLLLLSTNGCKKLVLDGIIAYSKDQDLHQEQERKDDDLELEEQCIDQDQLRNVEGTIILHIIFAIRMDHKLGRELLKDIKTSCGNLCPFSIALLLSVARIQRFEGQVFDHLKAAVVRSFKDEQLLQGSKFLRNLVPVNSSVAQMILDTVKNSVSGWDYVNQGLVQLGFLLMDSFGPKPGPFGKTSEVSPGVAWTPTQLACKLGRQVLLRGFKMHEHLRREILEQVLNRLVTKTASPVSHYLELFSDIAVSAQLILIESSSKLTETFDQLSFLPLTTVQGFLKAVQPLLRVSMSMKDALILVLRKAMFSSHLDGRKSALTGFLLLLKNFKVLGSLSSSQCSQAVSSSQVQVDVHSRYNSAANEAFCLEILNSLRRCLSQQADVRLMLYEGFYDVLRRNSQLSSSIMQTLLLQLKQYYEPEQDLLPPVKLEPCVTTQGDQTFLQEPLAHLLSCTVHCLLWLINTNPNAEIDDEEEGFQSDLQAVLESTTRRMIKCELEDFELDKSVDFSMGSGVGVKNNICAVLVMGVYEVLMEYSYIKANYNKNSFEDVVELFNRYHKLLEISKEKAGKSRNPAHKSPRSLLSMSFVATLITALFRDNCQSREEALSVLRSNAEFVRFILSVVVQKIKQLEESGHTDGPDGQNPEKTFRFLCDMTSLLMWRYTNIPAAAEEETRKKEKRSSSTLLCLEGLLRIFTATQQRYPDKMTQLFSAADVAGGDADQDDIKDGNFFYIKQFQRALFNQLSGEKEEVNSKEAQLLVGILSVLSQQLKPSSNQFDQMVTWTLKICKETSFEDPVFCKGILSLLLNLHALSNSPVSLLQKISQDIHSRLGDIDEEVEIEIESHFAIVTTKTASTAALVVSSQIEKILDEVNWLIAREKSRAKESGKGDAANQRDLVEKAMTQQLETLLTALNNLIQTAHLPEPCTISILRALSLTYTALTLLVKYYIQKCAGGQDGNPSHFEKLIKLSGTHLTSQTYAFICALNEEGSRVADEKTKSKKTEKSTASAKLLRETKAIPKLIFNIEQYEKYLIILSKKVKINLMKYMKRSFSRDFRINPATLDAVLQEQEDSEEEEEVIEEEVAASIHSDETQEPQKKKRKQ